MGRYALGILLLAALPGAARGEPATEEVSWPRIAATGVLFVSGERLEPPYVFTLEGDTLRVNGWPVNPVRRERRPPIEVSEETRDRDRLIEACFDLCDTLLERGVCRAAVRDSAIGMLRASPRVADARPLAAASVRLRWKDGTPEEETLMIPVEILPCPVPWAERCRRAAERYVDDLSSGSIVIVSAGGEMILPAERLPALERELDLLLRLRGPDFGELEILSSQFAREFLDAEP